MLQVEERYELFQLLTADVSETEPIPNLAVASFRTRCSKPKICNSFPNRTSDPGPKPRAVCLLDDAIRYDGYVGLDGDF